MTVERANVGHETRYAMRHGAVLRAVLVFDTGAEGDSPAAWKILLPGQEGSEDLYGTREFPRPDAVQLTDWLTPIVGQDVAATLAAAVDASPPPTAGWQRAPGG
jgi:hypothetical protein